jgi:hypothetical protein
MELVNRICRNFFDDRLRSQWLQVLCMYTVATEDNDGLRLTRLYFHSVEESKNQPITTMLSRSVIGRNAFNPSRPAQKTPIKAAIGD